MVALKTLRTSLLDDENEGEEFRVRFLREAQTAGILNHPSIVMIHDVGEDKSTGISYIAMEYVEGKNLKQLVQEGTDFRPEKIADIIGQVAEGLDFAHSKGIVHRDVKPANIIMTEDGKSKITDFGIAKIQSSNLTSTGQFLGTPNYMSPEQVTGNPVDHRSDLFSLGVVLYELLTKKKPFAGDNLTAISYKIVHEAFTRPRDVRSEIPTGFDSVLDRALSKDPAKRYQRGKEMADDLRRIFPAIRMTTVSPPAETGDPRSTLLVAKSAGAPAAPPPPAAAASAAKRPQAPTPPPAPPPKPKPAAPPAVTAASGTAGSPPPPPAASRSVEPHPSDYPGEEAPSPATPKRSIWFAEIYTKWAAMIIGGCAVLALAGLSPLIYRVLENKAAPADSASIEQASEKRKLIEEAQQLMLQKKLDESESKIKQLMVLSPDSARGRELLKKIAELRGKEQSAEKVRSEIDRHLKAGKILYDESAYGDAMVEFQEVLNLDANNPGALEFLKLSQEKQSMLTGKKETKGQEEISGKVQLNLRFKSASIGKGYLLIYFGTTQVSRDEIKWMKKTGFLSSEEIGGELKKAIEIPAGDQQIRVQFVNRERGIDIVQMARGNFPFGKGKIRTLSIELDEQGKRLAVRVL